MAPSIQELSQREHSSPRSHVASSKSPQLPSLSTSSSSPPSPSLFFSSRQRTAITSAMASAATTYQSDPLSPVASSSGRTSPGPSTLTVPEMTKSSRRRQFTDSSQGSTSSQTPLVNRQPQHQSSLSNVYSAADEYSTETDEQTRDPLRLSYQEEEEDPNSPLDAAFVTSPGWLRHGSTDKLYSPNEEESGASRAGPLGREAYSDQSFSSKYDPYPSRGRMTNGNSMPKDRSRSQQTDAGDEEDEKRDAAQVEQNLERWAAAERQRRKAARTSRNFAESGGSSSDAGLVRKFSRSINKGGARRDDSRTPASNYAGGSIRMNGSVGMHKDSLSISSSSAESSFSEALTGLTGRSSQGSADSSAVNGTNKGHSGGVSLANVPERDDDGASTTVSPTSQDQHADRKGKAKASDSDNDRNSPFADPTATFPSPAPTVRPNKPTAFRPIVTVGRAPSVQRTPVSTPKIVATDVDGRTTTSSHGSKNPFLSKTEAAAVAASSKRISEEVEEELDVTSLASRIPDETADSADGDDSGPGLNPRKDRPKSLASLSKFRELGLDGSEEDEAGMTQEELMYRQRLRRAATSEGDDEFSSGRTGAASKSSRPAMLNRWSTHVGSSTGDERLAREAEEDRRMIREGKGRQPWWTEWLCGCGRVVDEDNEQCGKTMPD